MTVEELLARESIRQTMVQYNMAGDRLRLEEFLAVFTTDAVLESEGVPEQDRFRYAGREQIAGWITRWTERSGEQDDAPHGATFIRHHLSTCQIEFTGEQEARGRTYWVAYTDIGPDHAGYYLDRFRCEDGRWLIAHRRVRLDWRSEQSLFTTAVNRTR